MIQYYVKKFFDKRFSIYLLYFFLLVTFLSNAAKAQVHDLKKLKVQTDKSLKKGNLKKAEGLAKKSVSIAARRFGKTHPHYATSIYILGKVYASQRRLDEALKLQYQALKIRKRVFGTRHPAVAAILMHIGRIYVRKGDAKKAYNYAENGRRIFRRRFGNSHISVANANVDIARVYMMQGNFKKAIRKLEGSKKTLLKRYGNKHPIVLRGQVMLGTAYEQSGNISKAEKIYQTALTFSKARYGINHPSVANLLTLLGRNYSRQNKDDEALSLLKKAVKLYQDKKNTGHPSHARALNILGIIYNKQKQYNKAISVLKRSLEVSRNTYGDFHLSQSSALNNLSSSYQRLGKVDEAIKYSKKSLEIVKRARGPEHVLYAAGLTTLAISYQKLSRLAEAEKLLHQAYKIRRNKLGDKHPDTIIALGNLANYNLMTRKYKRAFIYSDRALNVIAERNKILGFKSSSDIKNSLRVFSKIYQNVIRSAHAYSWQDASKNDFLLERAFLAAQQQNTTQASTILSRVSARYASGVSQLSSLIRRQQDITILWQNENQKLIDSYKKLQSGQRASHNELKIKERLQKLENESQTISKEIHKKFPRFNDLSNPKPLSIKSIQGLLKKDEALISYLVLDQNLFLWVVSRNDAQWFRSKIKKEELISKIADMRKSLQVNKVDSVENLFNLHNAYELYRAVLEPGHEIIKDKKKLILVPTGPLMSLPFQVLVTEKSDRAIPLKITEYARAKWLIKSYALAVLPSVSSLQAIRSLKRSARAPKPLIGYGNPIFKSNASKTSLSKVNKKATRSFIDFYQRDSGVDMKVLQNSLEELPETESELVQVAKILKAPESVLRLREKATEADVKKRKLEQYQVVYFATHGLVAADMEKIGATFAEPALALTIPKRPSKIDDGLLTASEIAKLRLNADWVVLSACNTAIDGEPKSEALSSLSKAFLYAGSRALLVSHWPVVSEAANKLNTRLFKELQKDTSIGKAEALRLSMLALMNDKNDASNPYPYVWAPFIIIGDG